MQIPHNIILKHYMTPSHRPIYHSNTKHILQINVDIITHNNITFFLINYTGSNIDIINNNFNYLIGFYKIRTKYKFLTIYFKSTYME